jgi:hypothetical protein
MGYVEFVPFQLHSRVIRFVGDFQGTRCRRGRSDRRWRYAVSFIGLYITARISNCFAIIRSQLTLLPVVSRVGY